MNQIDKQTVDVNVGELPLLSSFLTKEWIKEELNKNKPSVLIYLLKYDLPTLQALENNLKGIRLKEINKHKKHMLGCLKGEVSQVYGIISEIDIWAHLKKNKIFCVYQPKIANFDKNPDFLIQLEQDDIIVEVATLNEDYQVKKAITSMFEDFKKGNKSIGCFVVNEVTLNSDCYRFYELLKGKSKQLKKDSKNILIINTLFAEEFSLRNAIKGYYQLEKDGRQMGYISKDKREKDTPAFFAQKDTNKRVNLIVGYNSRINNHYSTYFHDNPHLPFTQQEKIKIGQIFPNKIKENK